MKTIAVLTSGGDGPGMNAAIRSVVRSAVYRGMKVYGVMKGYDGLIDDDMTEFNARSVGNILSRGGTILKTSRCERFFKKKYRRQAYLNLKARGVEGLVVIGGNGSFRGADIFQKETGLQVVGVPGTIDNDINGSDYTIGAHTAVDTALDAIDKIRDTVISMERIYVIEVMGRFEPFISIMVGLAGGAEDVVFPGGRCNINAMCNDIKKGRAKGKISWIIVVSEGAGCAADVAAAIKKKTGYGIRSVTIGHVQRGGSPSTFDRVLASRLGAAAVDVLAKTKKSGMVGTIANRLNFENFKTACKHDKRKTGLEGELYKLIRILAT